MYREVLVMVEQNISASAILEIVGTMLLFLAALSFLAWVYAYYLAPSMHKRHAAKLAARLVRELGGGYILQKEHLERGVDAEWWHLSDGSWIGVAAKGKVMYVACNTEATRNKVKAWAFDVGIPRETFKVVGYLPAVSNANVRTFWQGINDLTG